MNSTISNIDIAIVLGYLVLVLCIGFWVARRTKTGEDLFLGGRSFGWGLIALSLFASNISSSTIIGLSGAAYTTGIVNSVYEWMSGIPLIIAALIFVPLYLRSRITTIPEFLEKRFDRRSQLFFSGVTIFSTIMIETAGALYAGSLVLQTFFPGLVLWQTAMILAVIAGVYTASGGLKAVVITDAIQAIILIVGCSIMTYMLFKQVDFDWSRITEAANVPDGHFSVVQPLDAEAASIPWLGLIMGVPVLGFWYWSTNQYIVQRVLGAKDIRHARWGVILAGFLKIIPLFVMVIPGAIALVLYPNIPNNETGDATFPFLITTVLPTGLVGLVLAGLISAIMSSVDSALNSSSTLVVIDFIKPGRSELTEQDIVNYGRITTIMLMIIAALWAPQIANFKGLWGYLQQMFSILVPPIAVIFMVGVFYKRGNGDGSFWTLVLGTAGGVLWFVANQLEMWYYFGSVMTIATILFIAISQIRIKKQGNDAKETGNQLIYITILAALLLGLMALLWSEFGFDGLTEVHYTINVGLMVIVSSIIFITVSQLTAAPNEEQIALLTYRKGLINDGMEGVKWYQDYRIHTAILFALIMYILWVFW